MLTKRKSSKPTIPPKKKRGAGKKGDPRNEAVTTLKHDEIKQWKKDNDYHQHSLSEIAMYRYKKLISSKLSLRDYNVQVDEKVINEVIRLGMPIRLKAN